MPAETPKPLKRKQEEAITVILAQPTLKQAAEHLGVNERTLRRWMKDPTFSQAYREARRQGHAHVIAMAQRYAPAALNVLAKIATDNAKPAAARVTASVAVLKFTRESIELDDLAQRLEALEAAARGTPS